MDRKKPAVDVPRILEILSDMYPNRAVALIRENIQNSIDAHAQNVWVRLNKGLRVVSFGDDGRGIPFSQMNEDGYFGLVWSTKKGGQLMIGGKGIGRLTNIAVAKKVLVTDSDGRSDAGFVWYPNGEHETLSSPSPVGHSGLNLLLEDVNPTVLRDIENKVTEVATDYFDHYLRRGVSVWFDGVRIEPKQFPGVKKTYNLPAGAQLETYWHARGQRQEDVGVVLKCMGVKVSGPTRLGIESSEWRNLAGVLHLDRFRLTSNRDAFEDTTDYRTALQEAGAKVRAILAHYEGGRQKKLDKVASEYTRAAREALRKLNIDLSILGRPFSEESRSREPAGPAAQIKPKGAEFAPEHRASAKEAGDRPGFRLVPKDFRGDKELEEHVSEMSIHRGPEILVNLGHPACPRNRNSRSYYIWGCCFAEIVRLGSLSASESLDKERFLSIYRGWLQAWSPELVKVTPGEG
jgi:Histidine kinase-, DNA gyrase B-, and HSP90-like ATPase